MFGEYSQPSDLTLPESEATPQTTSRESARSQPIIPSGVARLIERTLDNEDRALALIDRMQERLEADLDDPEVRAFWALLEGDIEHPLPEDLEPGLHGGLE